MQGCADPITRTQRTLGDRFNSRFVHVRSRDIPQPDFQRMSFAERSRGILIFCFKSLIIQTDQEIAVRFSRVKRINSDEFYFYLIFFSIRSSWKSSPTVFATFTIPRRMVKSATDSDFLTGLTKKHQTNWEPVTNLITYQLS